MANIYNYKFSIENNFLITFSSFNFYNNESELQEKWRLCIVFDKKIEKKNEDIG